MLWPTARKLPSFPRDIELFMELSFLNFLHFIVKFQGKLTDILKNWRKYPPLKKLIGIRTLLYSLHNKSEK
ncbi:hypothetical protein B0X71_14390 [Planococcus lenghuensis]|uniref:Uncharacterized protein n=1 Tax=Planococcus lenghuensis TaxID=2213202 RepID=A0A1Q2L192_9BACL|nr:hypothetical protein B0X71_14390 [Planococcus lenghuensis]